MKVIPSKVFVVNTDSHFILIQADSEEAAKRLEGKKLGDYLTSDQAHEALNTLKTIVMLGYGDSLKLKE